MLEIQPPSDHDAIKAIPATWTGHVERQRDLEETVAPFHLVPGLEGRNFSVSSLSLMFALAFYRHS